MFTWMTSSKANAKASDPQFSADFDRISAGRKVELLQSFGSSASKAAVRTGSQKGITLFGVSFFAAHAMRAEMLSL